VSPYTNRERKSVFSLLIVQDLDFYQSIKLVNYIRASVKEGNLQPDISSPASFADDKFLQPVLEDDALLFSLDELALSDTGAASEQPERQTAEARVTELEAQLSALRAQFADFRLQVDQTLERRWIETAEAPITESSKAAKGPDYDGDYFKSYSYNGMMYRLLRSKGGC
jgi:protein arginine N-methyltransferase 3